MVSTNSIYTNYIATAHKCQIFWVFVFRVNKTKEIANANIFKEILIT